jgi:plastocyanin
MSILGQRISRKAIAALAAVLLLATLLPALSSTPTREVTLVVKGMAFYLEDDFTTPNPVIEVQAGERVRIVVKNQERGLTHDFAFPAAGAVMEELTWNQTGQVGFEAPTTPGTYEYFCQPHRFMMKGIIKVE